MPLCCHLCPILCNGTRIADSICPERGKVADSLTKGVVLQIAAFKIDHHRAHYEHEEEKASEDTCYYRSCYTLPAKNVWNRHSDKDYQHAGSRCGNESEERID